MGSLLDADGGLSETNWPCTSPRLPKLSEMVFTPIALGDLKLPLCTLFFTSGRLMLLSDWTSILIFYSGGLTVTALATCLGCGDELMLSTSRCCFPGLECFLCLVVLERASEDVGPEA